ncbi:MAG: response regulator transcription factor [Sedimentisphaerales bacterium]|nr:response regulator transcription factor [Sedimentisphaerales bacterium]
MKPKIKQGAGRNKIKLLIVDDHAIVRQGLIRLIETEFDLTFCTEAENASQALEAVAEKEFDLAVVDISLEDKNGLELTKIIKSRRPNMVILILSMYDGLFYAQRALNAGASGYVAKYEAAEKIIKAIRQVLSGNIYVSDSKAVKMISDTAANIDN